MMAAEAVEGVAAVWISALSQEPRETCLSLKTEVGVEVADVVTEVAEAADAGPVEPDVLKIMTSFAPDQKIWTKKVISEGLI